MAIDGNIFNFIRHSATNKQE